MDTIPTEIFAHICSHLQLGVLRLLSTSSSNFNKLVKSDAVLQYHKKDLFSKWNFSREIQSLKATVSIYDRIRLRIKNQNRWREQVTPSGYVLPTLGDKIARIKCKKNRLLVLSVTETKTTKISMFDLETLHLLATTETNLFRGTAASTSILWKGGDWVVFDAGVDLYSWNSLQNTLEKVIFEIKRHEYVLRTSFLFFDGHETIFYVLAGNGFRRLICNLRTKKHQKIEWIECKDVYMYIKWDIRTLIYQKEDQKYYMEKFTADWKRTSSVALEIMDCYGTISFKITPDYTFVYYGTPSAGVRVLSSRTGAFLFKLPFNVANKTAKLRYSKEDGMLIHQYYTKAALNVYSLKGGKIDHIQWITQPQSEKIVLKTFTPELVLIKYGKSVGFKTPKTTKDIVSGGKLIVPFAKLIPPEYEKWNVMNTALSETQIIFHIQSQNKQNAIILFDYCHSVVQN
jgi:hypothetical protein